jgi:hypothetical protein
VIVSAATAKTVARARVSLAGRVAPLGSPPPYRCTLTLTTVTPDRGSARPDGRTYTAFIRPDGLYYFQNVPPGSYRLTARDDKDRTVVRDLALPPGVNGERPRVVEMDLQFTDPQAAEQPSAEQPPTEQPRTEPVGPSIRPAASPVRRGRAKTGR